MKSSTYCHCCTVFHQHLYYWLAVFVPLMLLLSSFALRIFPVPQPVTWEHIHSEDQTPQWHLPLPCQPIHHCFFRDHVLQTISDNPAGPPGDCTHPVQMFVTTTQIKAARESISSILCTEVKNFDRHVLDLRDMWRMKRGIYFKHCAWHCVLFCPRSFSAKALLS